MANSNPHKIPRRARALLARTLAADLPESLIEWVSEALVTGTIPQRVPPRLNSPNLRALHEKEAALYWIASDLWHLHCLVYRDAFKTPWKTKRVAMRLTTLEYSLYKYEKL
jgi:hypothetical protein